MDPKLGSWDLERPKGPVAGPGLKERWFNLTISLFCGAGRGEGEGEQREMGR